MHRVYNKLFILHSLECTFLSLDRYQEVPSDIPMQEDHQLLLLVVKAEQLSLCIRWWWAKSTFGDLPATWINVRYKVRHSISNALQSYHHTLS